MTPLRRGGAEPSGLSSAPPSCWKCLGVGRGHTPHRPGGRGRAMTPLPAGVWGRAPPGLSSALPLAGNAWELDGGTPLTGQGDGGRAMTPLPAGVGAEPSRSCLQPLLLLEMPGSWTGAHPSPARGTGAGHDAPPGGCGAEPLTAVFSPPSCWKCLGVGRGHTPHRPGGRGRAMTPLRRGCGAEPSWAVFSPPSCWAQGEIPVGRLITGVGVGAFVSGLSFGVGEGDNATARSCTLATQDGARK